MAARVHLLPAPCECSGTTSLELVLPFLLAWMANSCVLQSGARAALFYLQCMRMAASIRSGKTLGRTMQRAVIEVLLNLS